MSFEWIETTLGDICKRQHGSIQTGPFGSQLHASDYVPQGIPVVMPANIGTDGGISEDGIARITQADNERLAQHQLKLGDVVFSRRGDVTRNALVEPHQVGWLCGTGCLKVRLGDESIANAKFISYCLRLPETKDWLIRHAVGATMPNLNTSILSAVPVFLPPLKVQKEITEVLGSIDDRITLLRETNTTLEAIAQALFKSWFVDFDPVHAKQQGRTPEGMDAQTAALFPDSFEESELGMVPKGWRVGTLGDIAQTIKKQISSEQLHSGLNYVGLEHIPRKSLSLTAWNNAEGLESAKAKFGVGDVLFGKLRPYFHKVVIAPVDGVCSTDILVCSPKKPEYYGLVAMQLFSKELIDYADRLSNGAKMPRVNWSDLAAYPLAIPPEEISSSYTKFSKEIFEKMQQGVHQMQTLAKLRDTLLPRLISGQLRLPEAQALVEDAVDA